LGLKSHRRISVTSDTLTISPRFQLGIPTANIPSSGLSAYPGLPTGAYYGIVGLRLPPSHPSAASLTTTATTASSSSSNSNIYEAVLSIGFNPFYKNTERSIEIHILHSFAADFYGAPLNLLILGFIRPEYDYASKESLIEDIKTDCDVARRSLEREGYRRVSLEGEEKEWLLNFSWVESRGGEEGGDGHGTSSI
jgi:riboflavin kinase